LDFEVTTNFILTITNSFFNFVTNLIDKSHQDFGKILISRRLLNEEQTRNRCVGNEIQTQNRIYCLWARPKGGVAGGARLLSPFSISSVFQQFLSLALQKV